MSNGKTKRTIKSKKTVRLDIDEENGSLQLITPISPDNPEHYADLLELNAFRNQLAGARFVLLREEGSIALLKHVEIKNLTLQEFELIFEEFLTISQKWSETFTQKDSKNKNIAYKNQTLMINDIFNRT